MSDPAPLPRHQSPRIALKVDCDTYVGTRDGVPRLLEIFAATGIRATFFFTFGPDRSGVAVRRFFTTPGFLRKMWKSRAASLYGFPTVVYGTLLPAPMIGQRCAKTIESVSRAGHEVGVHAWDHVGWHDGLDRWPDAEIRGQMQLAHSAFESIFGRAAQSSAAAGWTVNERSLSIENERQLLYTSNTRLGAPFFPLIGGRPSRILEIPTTLPTLDETLAWTELQSGDDAQRAFFRTAPRQTEVHTIHAEVEGRSKASLFAGLVGDWLRDGAQFLTLEELARERLSGADPVPVRRVERSRVPGRGGTVATGWPPA